MREKGQPKISLVIPVHNEEKNIPVVYKEAKEVLEEIFKEKGYDYEIIFVNDGSTDGSLEVLKKIKKGDPKVRVLNMDRNRGEAAALTAGFFNAKGEFILSMDGDGQNDPKYLRELVEHLEKGYAVVTGFRTKREEPFLSRVLPSRVANWLISLVTGLKVHDNGCALKGYRADIPKRVQIPHGFHRFIPALFGVKNNEVCEISVIDRPRLHGKSHYNFKRTLEVLRELLTIPFVLRDPVKWEKRAGILSKGLAVTTILALPFNKKKLPIITAVGSMVGVIIYKNLKRFNQAQEKGVFRVEEV